MPICHHQLRVRIRANQRLETRIDCRRQRSSDWNFDKKSDSVRRTILTENQRLTVQYRNYHQSIRNLRQQPTSGKQISGSGRPRLAQNPVRKFDPGKTTGKKLVYKLWKSPPVASRRRSLAGWKRGLRNRKIDFDGAMWATTTPATTCQGPRTINCKRKTVKIALPGWKLNGCPNFYHDKDDVDVRMNSNSTDNAAVVVVNVKACNNETDKKKFILEFIKYCNYFLYWSLLICMCAKPDLVRFEKPRAAAWSKPSVTNAENRGNLDTDTEPERPDRPDLGQPDYDHPGLGQPDCCVPDSLRELASSRFCPSCDLFLSIPECDVPGPLRFL